MGQVRENACLLLRRNTFDRGDRYATHRLAVFLPGFEKISSVIVAEKPGRPQDLRPRTRLPRIFHRLECVSLRLMWAAQDHAIRSRLSRSHRRSSRCAHPVSSTAGEAEEASCQERDSRAQQGSVATERGRDDLDHAAYTTGGTAAQRVADAREEQLAAAKEAAEDQGVWREEIDISGGRSGQPAIDLAVELRGHSVSGAGLLRQQLQAEAFAIGQPSEQAGRFAPAQGALEGLLQGVKGDEGIDAAAPAATTARPAAGDRQVADMADVLLGGRLDLAVDNQGGPDDRVGREQEQATKAAPDAEMVFSQRGGIDINGEHRRQVIASLQEIGQAEIVKRG